MNKEMIYRQYERNVNLIAALVSEDEHAEYAKSCTKVEQTLRDVIEGRIPNDGNGIAASLSPA